MRTPGDDFDLAIGHLLTEAPAPRGRRGRHPHALHRPRRGRLPHVQRRRRDPGARRGAAPPGPRAHRDDVERVRRLRVRHHRGRAHEQPVRGRRRPRRRLAADVSPGCPRRCAPASRCSTAPAGCTPRRSRPRRASCSSSARTSAGTTPSTRSWVPWPASRELPLRRNRARRQRPGELRDRAEGERRRHPGRRRGRCRRARSRSSSRPQAGITLVAFARPPHLSVYSRPDRLTPGQRPVRGIPASSLNAIGRAAPIG